MNRRLSMLIGAAILGAHIMAQETQGLKVSVFSPYNDSDLTTTLLTATPANTFVYTGSISFTDGFDIALIPGISNKENFAVLWSGYVYLEASQVYSFGTESDDGSYVYIDTNRDGVFATNEQIVNNGGGHGMQVRTGRMSVTASGYYGIAFSLQQGTGGYGLYAKWLKGDTTDFNAMTIIDTSAAFELDGRSVPLFSISGVLPWQSYFTQPAEVVTENDALYAESALGYVSPTARVSLMWGAEAGVFTKTNSLDTLVANQAFRIAFDGTANGTYFYRMIVEDDNAVSQVAQNADVSFHVGPITLTASGDLYEQGVVAATVTVSRVTASLAPLTVSYTASGTAEAGVDYLALPGSLDIPAGAASADIVITPRRNFAKLHDTQLTLTLADGPYAISPMPDVSMTIHNETLPGGDNLNVWVGSGNASVAANWSKARVPLTTDDILIGGYSSSNMTWDYPANDLPATVATWTQEAEYTGAVTLPTTVKTGAFPCFTVAGNMTVDGGVVCGSYQSNPEAAPGFSHQLVIHVGGNMTIGENGTVHVNSRGWRSGPGRQYWENTGNAAHGGGSGKNYNGNVSTRTYGSIFHPVLPGSSGGADYGGGVLLLTVDGNLVLNGKIASNGVTTKWGPGTGGSIQVYANAITGAGKITANGGAGSGDNNDGAGGGGGRIAVYTADPASLPSSSIVALGGDFGNSERAGTCGTVYLALQSEPRAGTLRINNENIWAEWRRTNFPGTVAEYNGTIITPVEDLRHLILFMEKRGNPQLSRNTYVYTVRFGEAHENQVELVLAGNTLTVRDFYPKGSAGKLKPGTYVKVKDVPNPNLNGIPSWDQGTVVVMSVATMFMVR